MLDQCAAAREVNEIAESLLCEVGLLRLNGKLFLSKTLVLRGGRFDRTNHVDWPKAM